MSNHEDGHPFVFPAKAGTQRRELERDVRQWDTRRGWIPACAGMTMVRQQAPFCFSAPSPGVNWKIASMYHAIALPHRYHS